MTYNDFLQTELTREEEFNFISLFSGAGFGDFGVMLAGGKCLAACEIDPNRAEAHKANINAPIWGNVRTELELIVEYLKGKGDIDLLVATPPCQSFSTANAQRGLREDPDHADKDSRNHLFFEALKASHEVKPKAILFENVPNFLKRKVRSLDGKCSGKVGDFISASLDDYVEWSGVVCFSSLGLPQRRKRSLALFVRKDLLDDLSFPSVLLPSNWPSFPQQLPRSILHVLDHLPPLDSCDASSACSEDDFLHQVPVASSKHYSWISSIPSGSSRSAWDNPCMTCGKDVDNGKIRCGSCGSILLNRPHVLERDGSVRLVKGFKTSYKRMPKDDIAPTITTASGSFSSDLKVHPTQNRVLSIRECAILQSIPYSYNWPEKLADKKGHNFREMIGEAVPPIVTYRFGLALKAFLAHH